MEIKCQNWAVMMMTIIIWTVDARIFIWARNRIFSIIVFRWFSNNFGLFFLIFEFMLQFGERYFERNVLIGQVFYLLIFVLKNFCHMLKFFGHFIVKNVVFLTISRAMIEKRIVVHKFRDIKRIQVNESTNNLWMITKNKFKNIC